MQIFNENLTPKIFEYENILLLMDINNGMSKGFLYEVALNFPDVRQYAISTNYGDRRKLGKVFNFQSNGLNFTLCFCKVGNKVIPHFLEECLKTANFSLKTAIRISEKEKDIIPYFKDCDIYVSDYDFKNDIFHKIVTLGVDLKAKRIDKYYYRDERSKVEWIRKNGIFKPMPDDYVFYTEEMDKSKIIRINKNS